MNFEKQQKCTVTCQFLANSDEKSTEPTKFFLTEYSLGCSGYVTFNRIHCFRVFLHFSLFHDLHCLLGRQQCAVKNVEYHALCLRVTFTVVSCVVVYKECVIRWTSGSRWCLVEGVVTLLLWIQFVTVRDNGDRGESYCGKEKMLMLDDMYRSETFVSKLKQLHHLLIFLDWGKVTPTVFW